MRYLLDTCVVSEFVTKRPNPKVVAFINGIDQASAFLSVITIGELEKGIAKLPASRKKQQLEHWFAQSLLPRFGGNVIVLNAAVMLRWGKLMAALESKGRNVSAMDSLIAAQALAHDMTLITRNVRDFDGTSVRIANPWSSDSL